MVSVSPRQGDPTLLLIIGLICLLVCVGVAISEAIKQTRLTFYGIKTDAICVRMEWRGEGRGRRQIPIFRFTTETGAAIEVDNLVGTGGAKIDHAVSVVYLPSNPKIVSISGIKGWGFLLFITTLGVLIVIFILHWIR
jgi:hypothetical protein